VSYLPFMLEKLHSFFQEFMIDDTVPFNQGWFSFEGVPLKWHYPVGLLYDLYSGYEPPQPDAEGHEHVPRDEAPADDKSISSPSQLPWQLTVHFTHWPEEQLAQLDAEGVVMHDAWINSVKEADFVRNGTARAMMALSKDDSTTLWSSVKNRMYSELNCVDQIDSLPGYLQIYNRLLDAPGQSLRHIPLKVYLPSSKDVTETSAGSLKVVQAPVPPMVSPREQQTIGTALNALLPSMFPSRRSAVLAQPLLHGCILPMSANVIDVMRSAAYTDGWIHLGLVMIG
jgi:autophagy-related protein 5